MPQISRWSPMAAPGRLHAVAVAREIGIRKVIIPRAPGHFSAFGMLFCRPALRFRAHLVHQARRRWTSRIRKRSIGELEQKAAASRRHSRRSRRGRSRCTRAPTCAMSARSMRSPSTVPTGTVRRTRTATAIKRTFDAVHEQRYGTSAPSEPAEIVSLRTTVTGVVDASRGLRRSRRAARMPPKDAFTRQAPVYFARQAASSKRRPIDRAALLAGNSHPRPGADRGACLDDGRPSAATS